MVNGKYNVDSPKMKTLHFYDGIYYEWHKNTCTSQCRKWNSIICKSV